MSNEEAKKNEETMAQRVVEKTIEYARENGVGWNAIHEVALKIQNRAEAALAVEAAKDGKKENLTETKAWVATLQPHQLAFQVAMDPNLTEDEAMALAARVTNPLNVLALDRHVLNVRLLGGGWLMNVEAEPVIMGKETLGSYALRRAFVKLELDEEPPNLATVGEQLIDTSETGGSVVKALAQTLGAAHEAKNAQVDEDLMALFQKVTGEEE